MITGDHPLTAASVARELGMLTDGRVVSGRELEAMSDVHLDRDVADIAVYARVSPADKLRVVYGVDHAPAVKEADVGVAMVSTAAGAAGAGAASRPEPKFATPAAKPDLFFREPWR